MSIFKKKRRKRVNLFLINDNYNSFLSVMTGLQRNLPECSSLRAEQIANIVHNNGKCKIYSGFPPEAFLIQSSLVKRGLHVISEID